MLVGAYLANLGGHYSLGLFHWLDAEFKCWKSVTQSVSCGFDWLDQCMILLSGRELITRDLDLAKGA